MKEHDYILVAALVVAIGVIVLEYQEVAGMRQQVQQIQKEGNLLSSVLTLFS